MIHVINRAGKVVNLWRLALKTFYYEHTVPAQLPYSRNGNCLYN